MVKLPRSSSFLSKEKYSGEIPTESRLPERNCNKEVSVDSTIAHTTSGIWGKALP